MTDHDPENHLRLVLASVGGTVIHSDQPGAGVNSREYGAVRHAGYVGEAVYPDSHG